MSRAGPRPPPCGPCARTGPAVANPNTAMPSRILHLEVIIVAYLLVRVKEVIRTNDECAQPVSGSEPIGPCMSSPFRFMFDAPQTNYCGHLSHRDERIVGIIPTQRKKVS